MPFKPILRIGLIILLVSGATFGVIAATDRHASAPVTNITSKSTQDTPTTAKDSPNYSLTDRASIWLIVNKKYPLPSTYVPADLVSVGGGQQMRSEAATAEQKLVAAAKQAGISLLPVSGYRSYSYQQTVYNSYVKQNGQTAADTFSARPGYSEHQSGLAIDIGNTSGTCELATCFGATDGGKWVATNAYKYGFVIRYPEGKDAITGYQYEPWHIRYVGTWLAQKIHDNPKTLEQYFNLPTANSY